MVYGNYKVGSLRSPSTNVFGIGPFIRYYFLPTDNIANIFLEGDYQYGAITSQASSSLKQNTFSFFGGPEIFLNTVVGIEFRIGYSSTKFKGFEGRNNNLQAGIGFQIHLEKDK